MNGSRRKLVGLVGAGALASVHCRAAAEAPPAALERSVFRTSDKVALSLLHSKPLPTDASLPTLLFLPGWGMPASIWSAQLLAFGKRYRCIALDPRGQGESEVPSGGYTIERRVADLQDLIAQHTQPVLIGWSLGVLEALHYVHLHGADALSGLVLVDNSVGEPPAPRGGDFLQRLRKDREATIDRFVRGMFASPPAETLIDEIKRSALKTRLDDSIALLSYPLPREHWRAIAPGFTKPLAYFVTPRLAAQAHSLKQHRPATRTEVFADAGHALFVDQAARFNAALGGFLTDDLRPT